MNIFCGSASCYDILEVERKASIKEIKKAYRKLSLANHPDKNKEANSTEVFRLISKAYEVLDKNDSRVLFDYYLDNPKDYFKVSGQHYFRNLPKSDVRIVIFIVLLLISLFQFHYQNQKYAKIVKYLCELTLLSQTDKSVQTKQTIELYNRANELYEITLNKGKS